MSDYFNTKTGEAVAGNPEDRAAGFLAGDVGVRAGKNVKVVSPLDGSLIEVKPENLQKMLEAGFSLPTDERAQHYDLVQAQNTTLGAIGTVAVEGANALSMGLMDVGFSKAFGEEYGEFRRAQREANPTLATATQIGTEVATALGTGGAALLGRGAVRSTGSLAARALSRAPAVTVTRAAIGAERMVANRLTRLGMRSRALEAATGAALEGAFFEAGREASNIAIEDSELSGVEILAAVGDAAGRGALIGGLAGGALGLLADGSLAARGKLRGVKTQENVLEGAVGSRAAAEASKPAPFAERMLDRGERFLREDTSLSDQARRMAANDDLGRTVAQRFDDSAEAARTGSRQQTEIADRLRPDGDEMLEKVDAVRAKMEVQERHHFYGEAMKEAPPAPLPEIQRTLQETVSHNLEQLRNAGVRISREPVERAAAKGAPKVNAARKAVRARQKALADIDKQLTTVERKIGKTRERAVTTQRQTKTRGLEAELRRLRADRGAAAKALSKEETTLNRALESVRGVSDETAWKVTGFDKGRISPQARGTARDLVDLLDSFEKSVRKADSPERAMAVADMMNRQLGARGLKAVDPTMQRISQATYETVRRQLTNETLFGGAARVQKPINAAEARLYAAANNIDVLAAPRKGARSVNKTTEQLPAMDSNKIQSFLRKAGRQENSSAENALLEYLDAQENLIQVQRKYTRDLSKEEAEAAVASIDRVRKHVKNAIRLRVDSARFKNSFQILQTQSGLQDSIQLEMNMGSELAAPLAFGIGDAFGVGGGALFALGTAARNAPAIAAKLSGTRAGQSLLGLTRSKGQQAISSGIDGFVGKVRTGGLRQRAGVIAQRSRRAIPRVARGVARSEEEDRYAYSIRTTQLYARDPQRALSNAVNRLGPMPQVAPNSAAALVATVQRAAQFLQDKLPPIPAPATFGKDDEIARLERIPTSAKRKFQRYYDAVNDPVGVLEGLADGEVTREGMEALQAVYPHIHQQLVASISTELRDVELAYPEQAFLSTVMGVPAGRSFDGRFIANITRMQMAASEDADQRRTQRTVSPSRATPPNRDFAEAFATRSQQIAGNAR